MSQWATTSNLIGAAVILSTLAACGGGGAGSTSDTTDATAESARLRRTTTTTTTTTTQTTTTPVATIAQAPEIAGCKMFPINAIFNTRIDNTAKFPAHPSNATWLAAMIAKFGNPRMHLDWGVTEDQGSSEYFGIPYNVVDGTSNTTNWPVLSYDITDPRDGNGAGVPDESDCAVPQASGTFGIQRGCGAVPAQNRRFPMPIDSLVKIEGGNNPANQFLTDSHVLVLEKGSCRLWESYYAYKVNGAWRAYSSAAWDLASNDLRQDSWGSGDAAGLPILPLLVRADEASAGQINHALRVTFNSSVMASIRASNNHVWPARHAAGSLTTGGIPFGALLRLRADFPIPASWNTQAKAIALAMKQYGLYIADNGSNFFVQGEPSVRWDASTFSQLQSGITLDKLEFVSLQSVTGDPRFNADSMAASW